jgi:PleD family two-component response regulator
MLEARLDPQTARADPALYRAKDAGRKRVELAAQDQAEPA